MAIDYPIMVIPSFNNVCGCMDLHTGAYFIAITQLVIGLITCAAYVYTDYWSIISGILIALAGGCLLFAAITKNRLGSVFYLIFTLIGIIFVAITLVFVITWAAEGERIEGFGGMVIVIILLELIWMHVLIYFWICGYSFYARFRN